MAQSTKRMWDPNDRLTGAGMTTGCRRAVATLLAITVLGVSSARLQTAVADDGPPGARGVVYHDRNGSGAREAGEEGLPGVRVSNGREVVTTDAQGRWELPADDEVIFFVIKPSGWMTPVDENNLPRFYYIHKPAGSPEVKYGGVPPTGPLPKSIDFPLRPHREPDRFRILVLADPQPHTLGEVGYLMHDVIEELIGLDAAFGVTLGDIVYDNLSLYYPLNAAVARIGLPWYNVIGNHDMNFDATGDEHSDETFEGVFGPPYYSFDYGPVHFIAMDTIKLTRPEGERPGDYAGKIDARQLEFIRNDLAQVPPERLVVLMMHIPFFAANTPRKEVANRQELFRLIENRPHTFSIAGHMHYHRHVFFDESLGWPGATPHHQVLCGAASGDWWRGAPDELGIPHTTMRDGTPNGYTIVTFDGPRVSMRFQAARRPADYQMNIYAPDEVSAVEAGDAEVLVNIFAGSARSRVEMRLGQTGPWRVMERVESPDPAIVAIKQAETSDTPPRGRPLTRVIPSSHLWRANLPVNPPPGTHLIHVRETDVFGQTHTGLRLIRVR